MSPPKSDDELRPVELTGPRTRVMDLLRRMARATALGGAAVSLASCESCVCDPLPPPITCANPTRAELQRAMSLFARWVPGEGGGLEVQLDVEYHGRQPVSFAPIVALAGAAQKKLVAMPASLVLNLAPTAGVSTVTVGVTFDCSGTTDAMTLSLDVRGTPSSGSEVAVTITSP